MKETTLFRLSQSSLFQTERLTSVQAHVDGAVTHFLEESAHLSTFASILAGTSASRFAKTGILAFGPQATGWRALGLRGTAAAGSLGVEAMAFETTGRLIETAGGQSIRPNLWKWNGEGGLAQGFFTSGITFTALRGAGHVAKGENIVFQHVTQSAAMVAGHNLAGVLNIIPPPEASLGEQFLDAEWMNLQLAAGMGAFHSMAPGVYALGRSWDLSLQSRLETMSRNPSDFQRGGPVWVLGLEGFGPFPGTEIKNDLNLFMTARGRGGRKPPPRFFMDRPIRSDEKNSELEKKAYQLDHLGYQWETRLDPRADPRKRAQWGGDPSLEQIQDFLPGFFSLHATFAEEALKELRRPENQSHPDNALLIPIFEKIHHRIKGIQDLLREWRGEDENREALMQMFACLYRSGNYLIELTHPNNYDPMVMNDVFDQYTAALLFAHEFFFPFKTYTLFETPEGENAKIFPAPDSEEIRRLPIFFGEGMSPRIISETYSHLGSLWMRIENGKIVLEGDQKDPEGEILLTAHRHFRFKGGAWEVKREYGFPTQNEWGEFLAPRRQELVEPEETQARLTREFDFYERIGVERIIPHDVEQEALNTPFASLKWFKDRLKKWVAEGTHEIPLNTIQGITDLYQIAELRDETTHMPAGRVFLRTLAFSWEGVLALPPSTQVRRHFEIYLEGRKTREQRERLRDKLNALPPQITSPTRPQYFLDPLISLYQDLRRQMELRHAAGITWMTSPLFKHREYLLSLRQAIAEKRRPSNAELKKAYERGVALLKQVLN